MNELKMDYGYTVETFSVDIPVEDYMARFRDVARFMKPCQECGNYGRSWGCPPFDFDTDEFLRSYRYAHIIAKKITPLSQEISIDEAQALIRPERVKTENELLVMERIWGGRSFSFVGQCLYCGDRDCRRECGLPCLHPDKVRPSLEAFGFDIEKTLRELFGLKLLWGENGRLPEYIVLVSALFHNKAHFH